MHNTRTHTYIHTYIHVHTYIHPADHSTLPSVQSVPPSPHVHLEFRRVQTSDLGCMLFALYLSPIDTVIHVHCVQYHSTSTTYFFTCHRFPTQLPASATVGLRQTVHCQAAPPISMRPWAIYKFLLYCIVLCTHYMPTYLHANIKHIYTCSYIHHVNILQL